MTTDPPKADEPRSIRLAHVRDESAIKSIGQLCYLVAFISALGTLEFLLFATRAIPHDPALHRFATPPQVLFASWALAVALLLNTAAQAALGYGLTRLQSWARWTVVALTGLSLVSGVGTGLGLCLAYPVWGLLSLVIGLALHGVILWPLLTPRSGLIFSKEYREVLRATPEIRSRMHVLLKLSIAMILAGVAGVVGYLLAIYLRFID